MTQVLGAAPHLPGGVARPGLRASVAMLGPAFVAAIAYVDPGNFATNVSAGAQYGYRLLWVVLLANVVAMPVQYLSAKLGIVTGRNLPELCRDRFPRPVLVLLWLQAEVVAMATDIAEFVGAAVGLNLLFGVPLVPAALIATVVVFVVLALSTRGYRVFELLIGALLALICAGLVYDVVAVHPAPGAALRGFVPSFSGSGSILLAVGIVGATVMPHAVYLHSGLTSRRAGSHSDADRHRLLRFQRLDVVLAMGLAGVVNLAMLAGAGRLLHTPGRPVGDATLPLAHQEFGTQVGGLAALLFAAALLASGISASSVGTYTGQMIMEGMLRRQLPLTLRRAITVVPALALLIGGADPTQALVYSQVVLSFGIPFALVPLVLLTRDPALMGTHTNDRRTTTVMGVITAALVAMNGYLVVTALTAL